LSAEGDADGDGVSNRSEYLAADKNRAAYLKAALDPSIKKSKEYPIDQQKNPKKLQVGILLYPGFELLDVYGPVQMWSYISNFEVIMLAEKKGAVKSAQGTSTLATHSFDEVQQLDIVLVPGGFGTQTQLHNDKFIDYIRQLDKTSKFTTSVCTGSALLAKAGVLDGQKATSNKRFFYLAEQQSQKVNWVAEARWVQSGKYFTSSGVSAGTDMALGLVAKLYGKKEAKNLASSLEYEWQSNSGEDKFAPFIQRLVAESKGPAELIKTAPLDKSHLKKSPQYLHLIFNKLPDAAKSRISLQSADGTLIPLTGQHSMGANDLMISVSEKLKPGKYSVSWTAIFTAKTDNKSESLQGEFTFHYLPE
jgi:putative intracellular protease/amidase/methionine-rich copper-binding protein CopC